MEKEIISYIRDEYNPDAIVLAGSRIKGTAQEDSDWDLWVLGSENNASGFFHFKGTLLDITTKNWPEEGKPLTTPYSPVWPLNVLWDASNGRLASLLKTTEEAFNKGPLDLYKSGVLERFAKLSRWQGKMKKYQAEPMVECFYANIFYEFAIRAWFELQNKWVLAPAESIPYIKNNDQEFFELLRTFVITESLNRGKVAQDIFRKLEALKNQLDVE